MQACECELHLGLDTRRPDDPAPSAAADRCRSREVLPTPASAENQHAALARAHSRDESLQHVALAGTTE